MFVFFSVSAGKRPVYLLPLYPALALLFADWFYGPSGEGRGRLLIYRAFGFFAAATGALLLIITVGGLWNHDPGWFFAPIESMLRPKDRANIVAVKLQLDDFGWKFTLLSLAAAALWLSIVRFLWRAQMRAVAHHLVAIAFIHGTLAWSLFMPVIAQEKSYRDFMVEVNRLVEPEDKLYLHGRFNSAALLFYRGRTIEKLDMPLGILAPKLGRGDAYVILPEPRKPPPEFPRPLAKSSGAGPEGDAILLLMRAHLTD
jgi:hypothetical protein